MSKVELPPSVLDCLKNEMQIEMEHFFNKYDSFDDSFKATANRLLVDMLRVSKESSSFNEDVSFYEDGTHEQNKFMDAMFDCFKLFNELQSSKIDLLKRMYKHHSRSEGYWFPVVVISKPLASYLNEPSEFILYRGCYLDEYNSKDFRQPWTSDLDTAKRFAFIYGDFDKSNRVVVKAKVKNTDIAWIVEITTEHEIVLLPDFSPIENDIELSYIQYCESKNQ
ncbi:hypothetical protein [Psychrobacter sp.]|uniref:hypothetical protein n=1 Tax=Psychrobacter sp. TaxID=56811 RepID=UPI003567DFCC